MRICIPGRAEYELTNLILDLNGTLSQDGELIAGVAEKLAQLRQKLRVVILTADTHGRAAEIRDTLGLEVIVLQAGKEAEQKSGFLRSIGPQQSVAIGNGANDALMLSEAAIGIVVVGPEGAFSGALSAGDIIVSSIIDALDMLLVPRRILATLRR